MNDAGGLGGRVALVDRPGAHFLDACGEVGLKAQKFIARADHAVKPGFRHPHVFEEHFLVGVVKIGDVGFRFGAHGDDGGILFRGKRLHFVKERVVFKAVIVDVGNVHDGLHREEEKRTDDGLFFVGELHAAGRFPFVQSGLDLSQGRHELKGFLVAA